VKVGIRVESQSVYKASRASGLGVTVTVDQETVDRWAQAIRAFSGVQAEMAQLAANGKGGGR
jgi:hypothetical protein